MSGDGAGSHLVAADPAWADVIARIGPYRHRVTVDWEPYEALVRAIAHQQLNGRAAETILGRFVALYPGVPFPSPDLVLATEDSTLRACGFSAAKVAAIRDIAAKTDSGIVPTRREADGLEDEALIERLVSLRGVGRWTVEMLLIHTLARPDILPVDDFGVREGWRLMKAMPEQLKPKALAAIGEAWSPYRSTATWYLWRVADAAKGRGPSEVTA